MEWQQIEKAPKDGTPVLLVDDRGNIDTAVYICDLKEEQEFVRHAKDGDVYRTVTVDRGYWASEKCICPTHWMPLPPPPA